MMMAKAMPVKSIADIVKEHDTRLWRVLNHYVHESRQESDFSAVTQVGVDETSSKRGHNYVSLFVDMKSRRSCLPPRGRMHRPWSDSGSIWKHIMVVPLISARFVATCPLPS